MGTNAPADRHLPFDTACDPAWSVLAALTVAHLVEGLGLATLLPIIAVATGEASGDSPAQAIVLDVMAFLGLEPELAPLLLLMIGAIVLKALITLGAMSFVGFTAAEVASDLRRKIVRNLMAVRWRYMVHEPQGRITNVVSNDATRAADAYFLAATFLALAGQAVVLAIVALVVSWKLSSLAFRHGAGDDRLSAHARAYGQALRRRPDTANQGLLVFLSDTLGNLKVIRAMGRQAPYAALLETKITKLRKALRRQVVAREAVNNLQDAVMAIFLGLGFYVLFTTFEVPLSELIVAGVVVARTVQSVGKLQKSYQKAVIVESAFFAARDLIDETSRDPEPNPGTEPASFDRRISFANVEFAHAERATLRGIDLEVEAGRLTVLTGPLGRRQDDHHRPAPGPPSEPYGRYPHR